MATVIEAPVEEMSNEPEANKLFRMVMRFKGSDLHLKVNTSPAMRLSGVLRLMQLPPLTTSDMERLMFPLLTPRQRNILEETGGIDFAHIITEPNGDETRFRVNLFRQRGRLSLVARRVNTSIPDFEGLGLPPVLGEIASHDQGIVILAGVTGSGKSTSIAAMLQYVNQRERCHIVTIEDPIEFTFKDDKCIINQREVGIDVLDWDTALKHAVRQDPDIILVGEMRDRDTFNAAMHAAETGHLVFGTIHASSAPSTISRILDLFPQDMHSAMRQNLAFNLKAIIAQKLLPTTKEWAASSGQTRAPLVEVMRMNPTVKKLILTEEDVKLPQAIRLGKEEGMVDFTESLRQLVVAEKVERATAFENAPNPELLRMALKGITLPEAGILKERSAMFRPFLALLTFLVLSLGAAAASDAAELFPGILAQLPHMQRGPGMYLNLLKFIPVVIVYLLWAWTTNWVEHDTQQLINTKFAVWNGAIFSSGVLGLLLVLAIPIYFLGLGLLLLAYFVPLLTYVYARNQTVPDDQKVLTPYHLGEVANDIFFKLGMKPLFNRDVGTIDRSGPPITFVGKTQGTGKEDPSRVRQAEESRSYMAAKELVYDAVLRRATDIHLEPTTEQLSVRYRIDGILHAAEPFDRPTGDAVVNVFKVLSAMDISEKRKPQDGSFGAKLQARDVDFRVATSGSKAGEKLVMRILDNASAVSKLEELGLRPKLVEAVRGLVTQPHGMFLCCGPTGAGKSTTLYAALREIDRYQRNIITVEDPIEYQLDNITQMEVNTKAGQTFATALRSILRQDPDVIMIGEIRDQETASIACQAANTGHMVFSTVHSNDAVTALFRLLDLGVEPFMIASALTGVLGQRLVRILCEACKEPYKPKPEFLKKANLPVEKVDVFYRRPENPEQVCPQCGGTGYFGRTGIYELLVLTEPMREMIRENPSLNKIKAEARKGGMIYLQEDGLRQVIQGRTSIEELLRVVK